MRHDTTGGLESVADYARLNIPMFECADDLGAILGRYVLEVQRGADGVVNVQIVVAVGSSPDLDMTKIMMNAIESQAALIGADWISCQTVRPGLVRKLARQGFAVHATVMRKRMRAPQ